MIRYVIRGATHDDEASLLALARHLNTVNLPDDPGAVREILDLSVRSFSGAIRDPRRREYVFVLGGPAGAAGHRHEQDHRAARAAGAPYIYLDVHR